VLRRLPAVPLAAAAHLPTPPSRAALFRGERASRDAAAHAVARPRRAFSLPSATALLLPLRQCSMRAGRTTGIPIHFRAGISAAISFRLHPMYSCCSGLGGLPGADALAASFSFCLLTLAHKTILQSGSVSSGMLAGHPLLCWRRAAQHASTTTPRRLPPATTLNPATAALHWALSIALPWMAWRMPPVRWVWTAHLPRVWRFG